MDMDTWWLARLELREDSNLLVHLSKTPSTQILGQELVATR